MDKHILLHKPLEERKQFKCSKCPYAATRKQTLKRHFMIHGSHEDYLKMKEEMRLFECRECTYTTRKKMI